VRANSSPTRSIGVPDAISTAHRWFFISCLRSFSTAGSAVSPSTPQFQELLSLEPSLLPSPLASLCFPVVRDQVGEREAVVARDEVRAVVRGAAVVAVQVGRPGEPPPEIGQLARVALV